MGKLIVSDSSGQVREYPLERERISIGRHVDNDICLDDKAVSGHHAVVITILQDSFIEDLDSTNGTQINGKPISKHPLSHDDKIQIGRNTLRYEGEADEDFEKTMVLNRGQFGAAFDQQVDRAVARTPPPPIPPPAAAKPLLGRLRVSSGPNSGRELELSKALTTIGKPGVQVAAITRRIDGYYIVHVGGDGQRPLVNGEPIDTRARKLNDRDTVELAGTQMTFSIVE